MEDIVTGNLPRDDLAHWIEKAALLFDVRFVLGVVVVVLVRRDALTRLTLWRFAFGVGHGGDGCGT